VLTFKTRDTFQRAHLKQNWSKTSSGEKGILTEMKTEDSGCGAWAVGPIVASIPFEMDSEFTYIELNGFTDDSLKFKTIPMVFKFSVHHALHMQSLHSNQWHLLRIFHLSAALHFQMFTILQFRLDQTVRIFSVQIETCDIPCAQSSFSVIADSGYCD
jgi:hypothetical protein